MPRVTLPDRIVVSIAGPDAEHLLQNLITTDLDVLKPGDAKPGALLTPQGKIMFDFLISRDGADGFRIDLRRDVVDDFMRRMMMYKLRAKAEITKQDQVVVGVSWGDESSASGAESSGSESDSSEVVDTRFRLEPVRRVYSAATLPPSSSNLNHYTALRIANAVAESGSDFDLSDAFPHDVLLDQLEGVGFSKGCYVGQEVVSRMKHRGTARRRVLTVRGAHGLPATGIDLTVEGRVVGTLGSVHERDGLAILRIDKVKAAIDAGQTVLAGDTPVEVSIPTWASFTFPADTAGDA